MLTQSGKLKYVAIRIQQKLQVSFDLNLKRKSYKPARILIVERMATNMWSLYICKELHCVVCSETDGCEFMMLEKL